MASRRQTGESSPPENGGELRSNADIRTGFFQGATGTRRAIQYAVVDGEALFEGDIILGPADQMQAHADAVRDGTAVQSDGTDVQNGVAITGQIFRWPGGVIPFTIDAALPNPQRVRDAIAHWEANTRIRFVARTLAHLNYVTFRPGNGCSSQVGMRGGQQFITLAPECSTGNTIHEIGHAVGLWHEQSREDRDLFVRIQWANIQPGMEHNFNQHVTDGDDIGPYDFASIMHYPPKAFSRNGQDTIVAVNPGPAFGQRTTLSPGDIATVNALYPEPKALRKEVKDVKERKDTKERKDGKDTKERKDTKETKDTKDSKETKDTKETKDRKDAPDEPQRVKNEKDTKDRKDVKDAPDRLPAPPSPPRPPFDAAAPADAGDVRIAALERSVTQLEHFIVAALRPDLSHSPLSEESDAAASELNAIGGELQDLAQRLAADPGP